MWAWPPPSPPASQGPLWNKAFHLPSQARTRSRAGVWVPWQGPSRAACPRSLGFKGSRGLHAKQAPGPGEPASEPPQLPAAPPCGIGCTLSPLFSPAPSLFLAENTFIVRAPRQPAPLPSLPHPSQINLCTQLVHWASGAVNGALFRQCSGSGREGPGARGPGVTSWKIHSPAGRRSSQNSRLLRNRLDHPFCRLSLPRSPPGLCSRTLGPVGPGGAQVLWEPPHAHPEAFTGLGPLSPSGTVEATPRDLKLSHPGRGAEGPEHRCPQTARGGTRRGPDVGRKQTWSESQACPLLRAG